MEPLQLLQGTFMSLLREDTGMSLVELAPIGALVTLMALVCLFPWLARVSNYLTVLGPLRVAFFVTRKMSRPHVQGSSEKRAWRQAVEYALIIAVVSIALLIALQVLTTGTGFRSFISRVATCLGGTTCV